VKVDKIVFEGNQQFTSAKLRKKLYPELIQNAQGSGYALILGEQNQRTVSQVGYV